MHGRYPAYGHRSLIAVAILLALVAHPLAHPLLNECACVNAVASVVVDTRLSVPAVVADGLLSTDDRVATPPAICVGPSRAPPVA